MSRWGCAQHESGSASFGIRRWRASGLRGCEAPAHQKRSARRYGFFAAIVVEAALGFPAEPTSLDIFYQQRARAIFRIRQPFVQHLHDRETGVESDEVGKFE